MFGDREFLDISKDKALSDLQQLFMLPKIPARIEGYDISHMGGSEVVASMVVFTNGVSDRAQYRKFKTKKDRNDDTGNMYETIFRRLSPKNLAAWGAPDLLLIDGGKGQLNAALEAMQERGVKIPIISIAKREEEIIIHKELSNIEISLLESMQRTPPPGVGIFSEKSHIVVNLHIGQMNAGSHSRNLRGGQSVSRYSDITRLFQRIRDESHRFAVSYHTVLKRKRQISSILEEVPGIGPVSRKKLLREFGSVKGVIAAPESELTRVVGAKAAAQIIKYIK
jgi:excinuclease ABC subunit C